eukprot:m51a1_g9379 hypothetical protein (427) ;mRNA; f:212032-213754
MQCLQRVATFEQTRTTGRCSLVHDQLDRAVRELLPERRGSGVAHVLLLTPRSGAALSLNENSDPSVRRDLALAAERTSEGSFYRAMTYGSRSLLIPVDNGRLSVGTWQGLYLCDWNESWNEARPEPFTVAITLLLSPSAAVIRSSFIPPSRAYHSMLATASQLLGSQKDASDQPDGLACVMVRHCSASMAYFEDRSAVPGLEKALSAVVPDKWSGKFFDHTYEGWDDMPGHAKNALVGGPCVLVPAAAGGRLLVGENEDIALGEHRDEWGSSGRSVSVTRVPGCFRGSQTVSAALDPAAGAHCAELACLGAAKAPFAAGLAILKGPASTCFVLAPSGTHAEDMWQGAMKQRRTSDEYLAGKGVADRKGVLGGILRSIVLGGGRTRILPVKEGSLWLPQGCAVFLVSTTEKPLQAPQQPVEISWFGP